VNLSGKASINVEMAGLHPGGCGVTIQVQGIP